MITTRDRRVIELVEFKNQVRQNWKAFYKLRRGFFPHQLPWLGENDGKRFFYEVLPDGAWKGQRCFIIGGGPSLRGFDFSKLKGELTIGINRAYEKFDCTIMFSMDNRYYQWIIKGQLGKEAKEKFMDFKGYRVWVYTMEYDYPKGIYLLNCTGGRWLSESMINGLGSGANSGYSGLNLATCLGANPIYLLGFDMKGKDGTQEWWHEGYPYSQPDDVYAKFRSSFNDVAHELENKKIKVINLSPDSDLRCFDFDTFENIKPIKRPIVISYFTKNTGYEEVVSRLRDSIRRFNLENDIQGIENKGNWQKNTQYKAEFIKKMLLKHKDRPVLFIDADAEIKQYPSAFNNLEADLAVCFRDYGQFPISRRRSGEELLSGTLYLANNEKTHELVDAWIQKNRENPHIWEQKNLQEVVSDWDGEIKRLPLQYCQIFDTMVNIENPVITHYQASRVYRHEVEN